MGCLEEHLRQFDGKAVSCLTEAQVACRQNPDYPDELIRLCFDPRPLISDGASWILKAELEGGLRPSESQREAITHSLSKITSWQAALHLFQVVELLDLSATQAARFADWSRCYADHRRPFLRAWRLHATVTLNHQHPELGQDVRALLAEAEQDNAASVRARARQLRKALRLM